jgi:hypothetical protein
MSSEVMFESEPAQPDTKIECGTYAQALYGLLHDRGIAENVFAARAKADLADALSSLTKRLEVGHEPEYWPLWVSQLTYAIDSKRLPKSPKDPGFMKASLPLEQLVKDTAARILESFRTSGGKRLILVGALNARVQDLGGNKFSFSLKQRWAFEDVEG